MKRVISAVVAILLLCVLCGCDDPKTPQGEPMEGTTQAVIDLVSMLPVGTMGVSLKAVESAVSLMEWCEASTLTAEQVKTDVAAHYESLEEFDRVMFQEQLSLITERAVTWQDATALAEDLRMVGLDASDYEWSARAFELAHAIGNAVTEE